MITIGLDGDRGISEMYRVLAAFRTDMTLANLSPVTIRSRIGAVRRLAQFLEPVSPLDAGTKDLARWQRTIAALSPASVDSYSRHVIQFYRWALAHELIATDPSTVLVLPRVARGKPHPVELDQMRVIFACTTGGLRAAYALGAFAGLRCAEIAGIQAHEITLDDTPRVLVHGKGRKDRTVPLVAPLVAELERYGLPRAGYVVRRDDGRPYTPDALSGVSYRHLRSLGIPTTLHSFRHAFATDLYQSTHDLLLIAELLGHSSLQHVRVYAQPDVANLQERMVSTMHAAESMLTPGRRLHAVC